MKEKKEKKRNQLFRKQLPLDLIMEMASYFGLTNLQDTRWFSRHDLKILKTVTKINACKDKIKEYYYPCKARTYLNDLNEKNVITILRQILRTRNIYITSKEKYDMGMKYYIYSIRQEAHKSEQLELKEKKTTVELNHNIIYFE